MKYSIILNHYKDLIENYLFDEYDILGFLIFIREELDESQCHFIQEFADLIAHRKRNKGIIKDNIFNAQKNFYSLDRKNKVKDYHGIKWETWVNEWKYLSNKLKIDFLKDNKKVLKEITICIFSLAQDTKYYDNDVPIGKVEPFIDNESNLTLATLECRTDSLMICMMKCGPFKNIIDDNNGFIDYPLETKRENSMLCLYCNNKKILEL